jgi:hypothetical protein
MDEQSKNYDYRNEFMQMERILFSTETPYDVGGETVELSNVKRVTEFDVEIEQVDGSDYLYFTEKVSISGNDITFKILRADVNGGTGPAELADGTDISGLTGIIFYKGYK